MPLIPPSLPTDDDTKDFYNAFNTFVETQTKNFVSTIVSPTANIDVEELKKRYSNQLNSQIKQELNQRRKASSPLAAPLVRFLQEKGSEISDEHLITKDELKYAKRIIEKSDISPVAFLNTLTSPHQYHRILDAKTNSFGAGQTGADAKAYYETNIRPSLLAKHTEQVESMRGKFAPAYISSMEIPGKLQSVQDEINKFKLAQTVAFRGSAGYAKEQGNALAALEEFADAFSQKHPEDAKMWSKDNIKWRGGFPYLSIAAKGERGKEVEFSVKTNSDRTRYVPTASGFAIIPEFEVGKSLGPWAEGLHEGPGSEIRIRNSPGAVTDKASSLNRAINITHELFQNPDPMARLLDINKGTKAGSTAGINLGRGFVSDAGIEYYSNMIGARSNLVVTQSSIKSPLNVNAVKRQVSKKLGEWGVAVEFDEAMNLLSMTPLTSDTSEDAKLQTAMGFSRDSIVKHVMKTFNLNQVAANRFLEQSISGREKHFGLPEGTLQSYKELGFSSAFRTEGVEWIVNEQMIAQKGFLVRSEGATLAAKVGRWPGMFRDKEGRLIAAQGKALKKLMADVRANDLAYRFNPVSQEMEPVSYESTPSVFEDRPAMTGTSVKMGYWFGGSTPEGQGYALPGVFGASRKTAKTLGMELLSESDINSLSELNGVTLRRGESIMIAGKKYTPRFTSPTATIQNISHSIQTNRYAGGTNKSSTVSFELHTNDTSFAVDSSGNKVNVLESRFVNKINTALGQKGKGGVEIITSFPTNWSAFSEQLPSLMSEESYRKSLAGYIGTLPKNERAGALAIKRGATINTEEALKHLHQWAAYYASKNTTEVEVEETFDAIQMVHSGIYHQMKPREQAIVRRQIGRLDPNDKIYNKADIPDIKAQYSQFSNGQWSVIRRSAILQVDMPLRMSALTSSLGGRLSTEVLKDVSPFLKSIRSGRYAKTADAIEAYFAERGSKQIGLGIRDIQLAAFNSDAMSQDRDLYDSREKPKTKRAGFAGFLQEAEPFNPVAPPLSVHEGENAPVFEGLQVYKGKLYNHAGQEIDLGTEENTQAWMKLNQGQLGSYAQGKAVDFLGELASKVDSQNSQGFIKWRSDIEFADDEQHPWGYAGGTFVTKSLGEIHREMKNDLAAGRNLSVSQNALLMKIMGTFVPNVPMEIRPDQASPTDILLQNRHADIEQLLKSKANIKSPKTEVSLMNYVLGDNSLQAGEAALHTEDLIYMLQNEARKQGMSLNRKEARQIIHDNSKKYGMVGHSIQYRYPHQIAESATPVALIGSDVLASRGSQLVDFVKGQNGKFYGHETFRAGQVVVNPIMEILGGGDFDKDTNAIQGLLGTFRTNRWGRKQFIPFEGLTDLSKDKEYQGRLVQAAIDNPANEWGGSREKFFLDSQKAMTNWYNAKTDEERNVAKEQAVYAYMSKQLSKWRSTATDQQYAMEVNTSNATSKSAMGKDFNAARFWGAIARELTNSSSPGGFADIQAAVMNAYQEALDLRNPDKGLAAFMGLNITEYDKKSGQTVQRNYSTAGIVDRFADYVRHFSLAQDKNPSTSSANAEVIAESLVPYRIQGKDREKEVASFAEFIAKTKAEIGDEGEDVELSNEALYHTIDNEYQKRFGKKMLADTGNFATAIWNKTFQEYQRILPESVKGVEGADAQSVARNIATFLGRSGQSVSNTIKGIHGLTITGMKIFSNISNRLWSNEGYTAPDVSQNDASGPTIESKEEKVPVGNTALDWAKDIGDTQQEIVAKAKYIKERHPAVANNDSQTVGVLTNLASDNPEAFNQLYMEASQEQAEGPQMAQGSIQETFFDYPITGSDESDLAELGEGIDNQPVSAGMLAPGKTNNPALKKFSKYEPEAIAEANRLGIDLSAASTKIRKPRGKRIGVSEIQAFAQAKGVPVNSYEMKEQSAQAQQVSAVDTSIGGSQNGGAPPPPPPPPPTQATPEPPKGPLDIMSEVTMGAVARNNTVNYPGMTRSGDTLNIATTQTSSVNAIVQGAMADIHQTGETAAQNKLWNSNAVSERAPNKPTQYHSIRPLAGLITDAAGGSAAFGDEMPSTTSSSIRIGNVNVVGSHMLFNQGGNPHVVSPMILDNDMYQDLADIQKNGFDPNNANHQRIAEQMSLRIMQGVSGMSQEGQQMGERESMLNNAKVTLIGVNKKQLHENLAKRIHAQIMSENPGMDSDKAMAMAQQEAATAFPTDNKKDQLSSYANFAAGGWTDDNGQARGEGRWHGALKQALSDTQNVSVSSDWSQLQPHAQTVLARIKGVTRGINQIFTGVRDALKAKGGSYVNSSGVSNPLVNTAASDIATQDLAGYRMPTAPQQADLMESPDVLGVPETPDTTEVRQALREQATSATVQTNPAPAPAAATPASDITGADEFSDSYVPSQEELDQYNQMSGNEPPDNGNPTPTSTSATQTPVGTTGGQPPSEPPDPPGGIEQNTIGDPTSFNVPVGKGGILPVKNKKDRPPFVGLDTKNKIAFTEQGFDLKAHTEAKETFRGLLETTNFNKTTAAGGTETLSKESAASILVQAWRLGESFEGAFKVLDHPEQTGNTPNKFRNEYDSIRKQLNTKINDIMNGPGTNDEKHAAAAQEIGIHQNLFRSYFETEGDVSAHSGTRAALDTIVDSLGAVGNNAGGANVVQVGGRWEAASNQDIVSGIEKQVSAVPGAMELAVQQKQAPGNERAQRLISDVNLRPLRQKMADIAAQGLIGNEAVPQEIRKASMDEYRQAEAEFHRAALIHGDPAERATAAKYLDRLDKEDEVVDPMKRLGGTVSAQNETLGVAGIAIKSSDAVEKAFKNLVSAADGVTKAQNDLKEANITGKSSVEDLYSAMGKVVEAAGQKESQGTGGDIVPGTNMSYSDAKSKFGQFYTQEAQVSAAQSFFLAKNTASKGFDYTQLGGFEKLGVFMAKGEGSKAIRDAAISQGAFGEPGKVSLGWRAVGLADAAANLAVTGHYAFKNITRAFMDPEIAGAEAWAKQASTNFAGLMQGSPVSVAGIQQSAGYQQANALLNAQAAQRNNFQQASFNAWAPTLTQINQGAIGGIVGTASSILGPAIGAGVGTEYVLKALAGSQSVGGKIAAAAAQGVAPELAATTGVDLTTGVLPAMGADVGLTAAGGLTGSALLAAAAAPIAIAVGAGVAGVGGLNALYSTSHNQYDQMGHWVSAGMSPDAGTTLMGAGQLIDYAAHNPLKAAGNLVGIGGSIGDNAITAQNIGLSSYLNAKNISQSSSRKLGNVDDLSQLQSYLSQTLQKNNGGSAFKDQADQASVFAAQYAGLGATTDAIGQSAFSLINAGVDVTKLSGQLAWAASGSDMQGGQFTANGGASTNQFLKMFAANQQAVNQFFAGPGAQAFSNAQNAFSAQGMISSYNPSVSATFSSQSLIDRTQQIQNLQTSGQLASIAGTNQYLGQNLNTDLNNVAKTAQFFTGGMSQFNDLYAQNSGIPQSAVTNSIATFTSNQMMSAIGNQMGSAGAVQGAFNLTNAGISNLQGASAAASFLLGNGLFQATNIGTTNSVSSVNTIASQLGNGNDIAALFSAAQEASGQTMGSNGYKTFAQSTLDAVLKAPRDPLGFAGLLQKNQLTAGITGAFNQAGLSGVLPANIDDYSRTAVGVSSFAQKQVQNAAALQLQGAQSWGAHDVDALSSVYQDMYSRSAVGKGALYQQNFSQLVPTINSAFASGLMPTSQIGTAVQDLMNYNFSPAQMQQVSGFLQGDPTQSSIYAQQNGIATRAYNGPGANSSMLAGLLQTGAQGGTAGLQVGTDENMSFATNPVQWMQRAAFQSTHGAQNIVGSAYSSAQLNSMNMTQLGNLAATTQQQQEQYNYGVQQQEYQMQVAGQVLQSGPIGASTIGTALTSMEGIQRNQTLFQYGQQGEQIGIQQQQMVLGNQQFQDSWNLQKQQSQYDYGYQKNEQSIQHSHNVQEAQWQQQDIAFSQNMSDVQFGFSMIQSNEDIRFSTGRQRRDLMRNQQEQVLTHAMQSGQNSKEMDRAKQRETWDNEAFTRQQTYFDTQFKYSQQQLDQSKKYHDLDYQLQQRQMDLTKEAYQKQGEYMNAQFAIQDKQKQLQDQQIVLQGQQIAKNQEYNQTLAAINQTMSNFNTLVSQSQQYNQWLVNTGQTLYQFTQSMGPQIDTFFTNLQNRISQLLTGTNSNLGSGYTSNGNGGVVSPGGYYNYANGGYTGDGMKNQPAGTVHKGEYVIPQAGAPVVMAPEITALLTKIHNTLQSIQIDGGNAVVNVHSNSPASTRKDVLTILDRAMTAI